MELSSSSWVVGKIAPHASQVFTSFITASTLFLGQVMLVQGVSPTVFVMYQFLVSTLSLALLAFIFERKRIPPLTMRILMEIFFTAFLGMTFSQIMFITALYYVPSTISSAALNLCPAVTYILCVIIRQEKLQLQTLWGQGKLLGTLISVSGAFCLLFWHESGGGGKLSATDDTNWTTGLLLLAGGVISTSVLYIMLGGMARRYPAEMSMTAVMMFFATVQTSVVAAVLNHNASQWKLEWSLELLNIAIGGVLASGLNTFLGAWCAGIKGPVFVASFNPLGILFTTLLEFLFLGHGMSVGSVFGSILIVLGLYMYLWSKSKEEETQDKAETNSEITTSFLG